MVGDVQPVTVAVEPPTFSMNICLRAAPPTELNTTLDQVQRAAVTQLLVVDLAAP